MTWFSQDTAAKRGEKGREGGGDWMGYNATPQARGAGNAGIAVRIHVNIIAFTL